MRKEKIGSSNRLKKPPFPADALLEMDVDKPKWDDKEWKKFVPEGVRYVWEGLYYETKLYVFMTAYEAFKRSELSVKTD